VRQMPNALRCTAIRSQKRWCVMLKARLRAAVGIVAVVIAGGVLAAQAPATPAFEVASIKLTQSVMNVTSLPVYGYTVVHA
jgi:hypothetical protein